jgi:hypothetical protein
LSGGDIAILELVSPAPEATTRFDIYRASSEINAVGPKAGYGVSGQGVEQPSIYPAGTKRDGQNRYEFYLDASADILLYDFDDGSSAHDTFGLVAGRNDLGLGNAEVMTAPGDSGGPTLLDGKITGVTSFRTTASGGVGDATPGTNSSFGEIGGDTRVSVFASWIDSVIDIIAPTTPGNLDLTTASDTGSSSTDNITNDTTPTFTWSAANGTGSAISGYWWAIDDSTPQTGGTFTTSLNATPTVTVNGPHMMNVVAVDVAGNFSSNAASLAFTIDTGLPTTPTNLNLQTASDTGNNTTDNITSDTTPMFDWTASSDAVSGIRRYWWAVDDSTPQTGGTTTTSLSATPTVPANGAHNMYVVAEDVAGNFSTVASLPFTIDTIAPRITDVVLRGSTWNPSVFYSYATLAPQGRQLETIYTEGVNRIQLVFNEAVNVSGNQLTLHGSGYTGISQTGYSYTAGTHTAEWSFSPMLNRDKYRIDLSAAVTDDAGNMLDGEWIDPTNGTPDNRTDDVARAFPSGDGTPGSASNSFQFMFAVLAGDYNHDGHVDVADEVAWASTGVFDGNGDGQETSADHDIWSEHFGESLPVDRGFGDYFDDDITDEQDYFEWRRQFGQTGSNLSADGNGDGVVDVADWVLFEAYRGNYVGAWHVGDNGFGGAFALQAIGAAPRVTEVKISGSNSTHAPFSFSDVDGSGEQLRTVPVGGADTVSITFSEDVNVVASNLKVVGLSTANVPTLAEFSYDIMSMTATWRFDDLVANDHYLISLSEAVTDIEGNLLDGEWVNPVSLTTTSSLVSEFPSGDGEAGGDFTFVFTLLGGDASRDNVFDMADVDIFYESWMAGMIDAIFIDGDANGDGYVDSVDWYSMASQGLNLQTLWILGDLNGDFAVDELDADILDEHWWDANPTYEDGDLNGDGDVNEDDVDLMFAQFGLAITAVS